MRLYEFDDDNPLRLKLAGITSQLRSRMRDTGAKKPFSVDAFIKLLGDAGIDTDREELIDMIQDDPLKNIISDIEGDDIIFKGQPDADSKAEAPDASTDTLEKMAKRAEKRRD